VIMAMALMTGLAVTACASQPASTGTASPFGTTVTLLGTYPTSVGTYAYVEVSHGMSDPQIISLARRLHPYQPKDTLAA
jgi:hypothetical protein